MKVILLESIKKLGGLGDEVNVKAGFGRNFLIPYGKAVSANDANRTYFESKRADLEAAAAKVLAEAQAVAAKLAALDVKLEAKASEEGKLFGSISPRDIANAITAAGVEVAKSDVQMPEGPVRALGDYEFNVHLHSDVNQTVKVAVVAAEA